LLVILILPDTVNIGLSVGSGKDAAPATFAPTTTTTPNDAAARNRSAERNIIDSPPLPQRQPRRFAENRE
jgi:hypothetical protein